MPKLRKTTKLHYGKYLYKAAFFNTLSFAFSSYKNKGKGKLSFTQTTINNLDLQFANNESLKVDIRRSQKSVTKSEYLEAKRIFSLLIKDQVLFSFFLVHVYFLYLGLLYLNQLPYTTHKLILCFFVTFVVFIVIKMITQC